MKIVIIGATSGIAQATARSFAARERASFFLVGRDETRLAAVAADLRARGAASATPFAMNLSATEGAADCLVKAEHALSGRPDLVLIAHGSLSDEARAAREPGYARDELAINTLSPMAFAYAAAANFRAAAADGERGGHIALITSVAGERGRASNFFYGANKAALIAFCSGLRASLSREGIAVTDLRPGFIATPMTAHVRRSPLFCSAERSGELCAAALRRRAAVAYIPGWWRWIMLAVRGIPERIFQRLRF